MKILKLAASLLLWVALLWVQPAQVLADSLPPRAFIKGFSGHAQSTNLSCESRSAVDWAAFWGVRIGEKKFLNRLPRSINPDEGYVGDPNDAWGSIPPASYGVHAGPVAALLRKYGLQAEARKNLEWDDLRKEIAAGRPVIVWVVGPMWRGAPVRFTAPDGHKTTVARYEHTMVLVGYEPGNVRVVDAYSGKAETFPLTTFLASWNTLGRMAVLGGGKTKVKPEAGNAKKSDSVRVYLPFVFKNAG